MNRKHKQKRTDSGSPEITYHHDSVAPGQTSRSALLRKPQFAVVSGLAFSQSITPDASRSSDEEWLPKEAKDWLAKVDPGTYTLEAYEEIHGKAYRRDIVAVVRRSGEFVYFQKQPDEAAMVEILGNEKMAHLRAFAAQEKERYVLKYLEEGWSLEGALDNARSEMDTDFLTTMFGAAWATVGAAGMSLSQKPPSITFRSPGRFDSERPSNLISSARELERRATEQERFKPGWKAQEDGWNRQLEKEGTGITSRAYSRLGDPTHNIPYVMERETVAHGFMSIHEQPGPRNQQRGYVQFSRQGDVNGRTGMYEVGGWLSKSGKTLVVTHRFFRADP
jgi:hypothetical protein